MESRTGESFQQPELFDFDHIHAESSISSRTAILYGALGSDCFKEFHINLVQAAKEVRCIFFKDSFYCHIFFGHWYNWFLVLVLLLYEMDCFFKKFMYLFIMKLIKVNNCDFVKSSIWGCSCIEWEGNRKWFLSSHLWVWESFDPSSFGMTWGFSFHLLSDILVLIRLYTADIADVLVLKI